MTTIDQHLQEQDRLNASFLATMAPVASDSELVLITLYVGGHCACDHAIRFRKQDIEAEPTPTLTTCCGKTLRVFRIHIKPDAQVPAVDHVRYALRTTGSMPRPGDCARSCLDSFDACLDAAQDDDQRRACSEDYGWCIVDCRSPGARRSAPPACNCDALQRQLELLQEELRDAPPGQKAGLIRRINRVLAQLESCGC